MTATIPEAATAPGGLAPGIYPDLPASAYHADPALSSTGARRLLPPSCPAHFRWEADNGQPPKRAWDLGTAAHRLVLDDGPELTVLDYPDYKTKAAQQARAEARAAGAVPLLTREHEQVQAMADAIRRHPLASAIFTPGQGRAEVSLVWDDSPTGVRRRARLDWLRDPVPGRRLIVPDYKTCADASPEALQRAIESHGYHQQAAWYLDGVQAAGLAPDGAVFIFVFQEKAPPYLVHVVELARVALSIGAAKNRRALEIYRQCAASGRWWGYADDITHLSLPPWAENRDIEEYL